MAKKPRDYKAEYARYHGKPEQIKKRAQRVQARRDYEKKNGAKSIPAGFDVDHRKPIDKGGTNAPSNLRLRSVKSNRGYKRDAKNNPI
jgi:hypothetical protein